jgi:hypothetical protein
MFFTNPGRLGRQQAIRPNVISKFIQYNSVVIMTTKHYFLNHKIFRTRQDLRLLSKDSWKPTFFDHTIQARRTSEAAEARNPSIKTPITPALRSGGRWSLRILSGGQSVADAALPFFTLTNGIGIRMMIMSEIKTEMAYE